MSVPKKHHYLPEFFMERWADGDACVTEYRRPREGLVVKKKHPAGTGYMFELYANQNKIDPVDRQALELVFMQKVDALAADARAYLEEHRSKPKDVDLRSAGSRFLLSLMHRSPERVKYYVEKVREYEHGTLNPDLKQKYGRLRGAGDPPTFEEWLALKGPLGPDLVVELLRGLIDSDNLGPVLNTMRWAIHELISNGLGQEDAFVMLAIAPSRLFIAARSDEGDPVLHTPNQQCPAACSE